MDRPEPRKKSLAKKGAAVAVGGGAGMATGGPVGAAIGATLPVVQFLAEEVATRVLSAAQRARVKTVLDVAATRIDERREAGGTVRDDDLSPAKTTASAKRIAEGILVTAQFDYDDRKAEHYGRLLANLAFAPQIDALTANGLLRLAADLSYTQLGLLSLAGEEPRRPLPDTGRRGGKAVSWMATMVHAEYEDLGYAQRELILDDWTRVVGDDGSGSGVSRGIGGLPEDFNVPSIMKLQSLAVALHHLMQLDTFDAGERDRLADALWEFVGGRPDVNPAEPSA